MKPDYDPDKFDMDEYGNLYPKMEIETDVDKKGKDLQNGQTTEKS